MVLSILSLFIFLSILKYNFLLLLNNSSIDNKSTLDEKIQSRIKLYLPEYQNKHIRLNELNNTNFNFSTIRNNRNTLLIGDDIIETYDEAYKKQKISERIIDQFIINYEGKYVFEPVYEKATPFKDGKAMIKQDGKWGVLSKDGSIYWR